MALPGEKFDPGESCYRSDCGLGQDRRGNAGRWGDARKSVVIQGLAEPGYYGQATRTGD